MVEIKEKVDEEKIVLQVFGEVDASSSIHLDKALEEAVAQHKIILVDLSNLEYISSAGLGVFMSYLDQIKEEGIHFALFGLKESVYHVFEILGMDQVLRIEKSLAEAMT